MATSTKGTTLKWGDTAEASTKVIDIKDFPDMGGAPNMLETTTLSDGSQTYIPGITQVSGLPFTANYTSESYASVNTDAKKAKFYVLEFGDGSKFTWQGQHTVFANGGGVDGIAEMTITSAPSTEIAFTPAA